MTDDGDTDEHDAGLDAGAHPRLSAGQVAHVRRYGTVEDVDPDVVLYRRGDRAFDFFLVLHGAIEVRQEPGAATPEVVTVYRDGQFTGELALLNGQGSLVGTVTVAPTRVVRLRRAQLRRAMADEPELGRVVLGAFQARRLGYIARAQGTVVVAGPPADPATLALLRFLQRNDQPTRVLDPAATGAAAELAALGVDRSARMPVVVHRRGEYLEAPTIGAVAERIGLDEPLDDLGVADVAVVGAGPAGLAAAVYAASEGLATVVLEREAPGGQAGRSSLIENYPGFPLGLSGHELARSAQVQAHKFGARIVLPRRVARLDCSGSPFVLHLADGDVVAARTVVVATGAHYRRPDLPELDRFEGAGVHYAASALEAALCAGEEAVVVGGANSAGQAAMYLSRHAAHVHVLVRGPGLSAGMSEYLSRRLEASEDVTVHPCTEITALEGDRRLERVRVTDRRTGSSTTITTAAVFLMVGGEPNTGWLQGCLELDDHGFVRVGPAVARTADGSPADPFATSVPGVFAVGDVRAGSVKRVASAVGDGAVVVSAVHRHLTDSAGTPPASSRTSRGTAG
ncbi:FAD-dependent oxidoreductase [Actinomycetospora chlora]|uniref:FAD-dependent oxidoreductase n=1 Tax=Actinomycetospora chlora TaxID=663608 RepID=UPI0031EB336F